MGIECAKPSLGKQLTDLLHREIEMSLVICQRHRTIFQVEFPCLIIQCVDLDRKDAEILGKSMTAPQGIQQEL
jgi:hypothetical protein